MSKVHRFLGLFVAAALAALSGGAMADESVPPPPDMLYYDMDFNNNGQRDVGDLAKMCEYFLDFRSRGHLTEITNRANMYHDDKLDRHDFELLVDEWLNPKFHKFLFPPPFPPGSSQAAAPLQAGGAPGQPIAAGGRTTWSGVAWLSLRHPRLSGRFGLLGTAGL